jgi:triosephosphate isomerase
MKYAQKHIIANWKNNPQTLSQARNLIHIGSQIQGNHIHYAVPAPFLGVLANQYAPYIGSQTIWDMQNNSQTGLFGAGQIKETGATFTLLGHSEERQRWITDTHIQSAIKDCIQHKMPICLCLGETIYENFEKEIEQQLAILQDPQIVAVYQHSKIIYAYEPVWAIGNNASRSANIEEITTRITMIKQILNSIFKEHIASSISTSQKNDVLYGGSVNAQNIQTILDIKVCDGVLIGRASYDTTLWKQLIDTIM